MSKTILIAAMAATMLLVLAACGGGSDGTGIVSRSQAAETYVVSGFGGSEDVRPNPIGTLVIESMGKEVFLRDLAAVQTVVFTAPAGAQGGSNQLNLGRASKAVRIDILTSDNRLFFGDGTDIGLVTLTGDRNIIYVGDHVTFLFDDQGTDNEIIQP